MPDMQFSELLTGDIFTADGVLYIKTGLAATALIGVERGLPKTFLPQDFVVVLRGKELQSLNDLGDRSAGRTAPKFHPDFQQTTPGSGYFVGSDGIAYAYEAITQAIKTSHGNLQGTAAYTQLEVLGLDGPFRGGQTPFSIPSTFY